MNFDSNGSVSSLVREKQERNLARVLLQLAKRSLEIDLVRQRLAEDDFFEPYAAF
jgi:hypothetical protein